MTWRWAFLPMLVVPAAIAACSASNGDSIPSEVRDAEALDANIPDPRDLDSSTTTPGEDGGPNPPKDSGPKDATTDVAADSGPTSESVRINEVYVDRSGGGSKAEYIEIRGPAGAPIDDVFIRILDAASTPSASQPYAVATAGTKMPASGLWVVGGFGVAPLPDAIISLPDGWDLDDKGAVQLLRGTSKAVVDVVGWTSDPDGGAIPQPSTDPKTVVESKPFILPATGTKAFGRVTGAADTNDNRADFCNMNASAKAANSACL